MGYLNIYDEMKVLYHFPRGLNLKKSGFQLFVQNPHTSCNLKQVTLSNTCHSEMFTLSNPWHSKQVTLSNMSHWKVVTWI
jgi:hypothetical protein